MIRLTATLAQRARHLGVLGFVAVTVACAPIVTNHGYTPPEEELSRISVGRDTRETVAETIGAPLNQGLERDQAWYYVSSRQMKRGPRAPLEFDRQIVAIRFADSGRVENIERFGMEDGRVVTLSARVTDPAVSDVGIIAGLFGNLGTPTAEELLQ